MDGGFAPVQGLADWYISHHTQSFFFRGVGGGVACSYLTYIFQFTPKCRCYQFEKKKHLDNTKMPRRFPSVKGHGTIAKACKVHGWYTGIYYGQRMPNSDKLYCYWIFLFQETLQSKFHNFTVNLRFYLHKLQAVKRTTSFPWWLATCNKWRDLIGRIFTLIDSADPKIFSFTKNMCAIDESN